MPTAKVDRGCRPNTPILLHLVHDGIDGGQVLEEVFAPANKKA
jgi:hypothetical protein